MLDVLLNHQVYSHHGSTISSKNGVEISTIALLAALLADPSKLSLRSSSSISRLPSHSLPPHSSHTIHHTSQHSGFWLRHAILECDTCR